MININIDPKHTQIGWVGTGVMGRWMCQHCLDAGYQVKVMSRTAAKLKPLTDAGAIACATPREVAENADVVLTMIGYPAEVEAVILGTDGVLAGLKPGAVVVDMSTSEPSLACTIFEQSVAKGCCSLDAPVSGGDVGAREAKLSIMVGGDEAVFAALAPLWQVMANSYTYCGPAGSGQHTKMVNQIAIASGMVAMVEALLYAYKAGLNLETALQAISSGAAGSWSLSNYAPRILKRDFDPGFFVAHFVKDLGIALNEAKRMQLSLPGLAMAHQLYVALIAQGHENKGTQSLILALEALNNCSLD